MPDMGYIPQVQPFQLPGPAKINTDPGLIPGLAAGLPVGAEMGKTVQEAQALGIANQYAPYMAQLKAQEIQIAAEKQKAEIQKAQAEAINGIGQIAPLLKLLPVKNAKSLLASHLAKLHSVYPDLPSDSPTPGNITDDNIDEVEQWAKGRPDVVEQGSPDALNTYDAMWFIQMGETQRDIVKTLGAVTPEKQFTEAQTTGRTTYTQGQESQRASAGATAPLVGSAYSVNLAKTALAKGDELNDHIALNEFGKLINNGTPVPLAELKKMATAGTWGPKFAQAFSKFTGEGALAPEQRLMMRSALNTLGESLQAQTATRTAQYPGAAAPQLPSLSSYKLGQTVKFKEGNFKKVKDGPDSDASTWQVVKSSGTP